MIKQGVLFFALILNFIGPVWAGTEDIYMEQRRQMVREQIEKRGISDQEVLEAMGKVPRHLFVPQVHREASYEDHPLPIGYDQTISQPYIVAYMTQAALLRPEDKVLEIGTGSGYQAAVLAEIVEKVYSIEILPPLAEEAEARLKDLGYENIFIRCGDGYQGWPEEAPFDAIIVTAAPEHIPEALVAQLKIGGRMIVPVGSVYQELIRITKTSDGVRQESLLPVRFVPMVHGTP
jgi:protein-L-isoaspartate(D-aspartate) O-methyltransferase